MAGTVDCKASITELSKLILAKVYKVTHVANIKLDLEHTFMQGGTFSLVAFTHQILDMGPSHQLIYVSVYLPVVWNVLWLQYARWIHEQGQLVAKH